MPGNEGSVNQLWVNWSQSGTIISPFVTLVSKKRALGGPDKPFYPWGCSGCIPGLSTWGAHSQFCCGSCRFVSCPRNHLSFLGVHNEELSAGGRDPGLTFPAGVSAGMASHGWGQISLSSRLRAPLDAPWSWHRSYCSSWWGSRRQEN